METKRRITNYWTKRSESFSQQRQREFHSELAQRWSQELQRYLPKRKPLKILDIGCGTGFFSGLCTRLGHEVTGIDLTQEMIQHARLFANEEQFEADFQVMDAETLAFEEGTFDVVMARNVTWTLPHTDLAYREWLRVLKTGGLLINIDGNYGESSMTTINDLPTQHAHHDLALETLAECESIQRSLSISAQQRPEWDIQFLLGEAISHLQVDLELSNKIYLEKDEFYNPTPLFLLCVTKKG